MRCIRRPRALCERRGLVPSTERHLGAASHSVSLSSKTCGGQVKLELWSLTLAITLSYISRSYSDHVINSLFSQIRNWSSPDYRTPKAYAIGEPLLSLSEFS